MKTNTATDVSPLFSDQPIRALTIRYLAVVGIPVEVIFSWQAFTNGDYLSAGANVLGLFCVVMILVVSLQDKLSQRLVYFVCSYYAVMVVIIIFYDVANPNNIMWLLAAPPLTIFCMGTKPGSMLCMVFFPFIIVALFQTETIPLTMFALEFRQLYVITYLLIFIVSMVSAWVGDEHLRGLLEAKTRIRNLEKFLPMCMHCKKVKVEDQWDEVETYIMKQSEVSVSHGLCDVCQKVHYQDLMESLQQK